MNLNKEFEEEEFYSQKFCVWFFTLPVIMRPVGGCEDEKESIGRKTGLDFVILKIALDGVSIGEDLQGGLAVGGVI